MDKETLEATVKALREEGSDTMRVEAKRAAGGLPLSVATTMSAFANTPGGGTIILGLDESTDFAATEVYDVAKAQAALASKARSALDPPVTLVTHVHELDGHRVVVAEVVEAPSPLKPVRLVSNGKAYLRGYDGDFVMSELEAQSFIANRGRPEFDREVVRECSPDDLDSELVRNYLETCRTSSSALGKFEDSEILLRTGVIHTSGHPTIAGLLALGRYPQQYLPSYVIRASVSARPTDPSGTRAADARTFDGPIPQILEEAVRWVQRNTRTRVRFGDDGHGRDEPEYPPLALRELIANALIHRDLGPHAASYPISLTLEHRQFVISNPGGLWGITVDRLGTEKVSSARNSALLRIGQNVRTGDGRRVVEGLATGISTVLESLSSAGMVPPAFYDQGVRFTVRVPNHALLGAEDLRWLAETTAGLRLSDTQRHALVAMRHGQRWTNSSFRDAFPRDSTLARADLQGLVDAGLAVAEGERGGRVYSLASSPRGTRTPESDLFSEFEMPSSRAIRATARPGARETNASQLVEALRTGPATAGDLIARTGLSSRQVKYALELLRERGRVQLLGRQGDRHSRYGLTDELDS